MKGCRRPDRAFWLIHPQEPIDAVVAEQALETALVQQAMEMRDRLADREGLLMQIERAGEQDRQHVHRVLRRAARLPGGIEANAVMVTLTSFAISKHSLILRSMMDSSSTIPR